jgi:two-component system nitrogen regulation sensor histidine kinase GlnL
MPGQDGGRLLVRQLAQEIKTPPGGLRGAAQLLVRELSSPAFREYTGVIISEADRLTALVDSMIGPARAPQKALINIHEICEHVYRLLRSEARAGVLVERDYDPSLPNAEVDANQIIQALLNIARNALLAVGERGRIVIRTRIAANVNIGTVRHKLAASLSVEDNGPGVPPEIADTIFFPLVTGRANGTGLGLAVSQDLAPRGSVDAFLDKNKLADLEVWHDPKMELSGATGAQILPTTILYGADGREVWRYVGDLDWTGEEAAKLLADAGPAKKG